MLGSNLAGFWVTGMSNTLPVETGLWACRKINGNFLLAELLFVEREDWPGNHLLVASKVANGFRIG
jgi:hypothetical protein